MKKIKGREKPDRAFELHREIIAYGQAAEQLHFIEMMKRLWEMKHQKLFKSLQYSSFNAYLHDAELPFPATTGHAFVKAYEQIIERAKIGEADLREIGQTKATIIARSIEGREITDDEIKDMVDEAKVQSVPTFRGRMKERVTGISQEKCKHERDRVFNRCPDCHRIEYAIIRNQK